MLDLKWIRENPEQVRRGLAAKNSNLDLTQLLELDSQRRALLVEVENLKAQRNKANDEVAKFKKDGQNTQADQVIASMKSISQKIKEIDGKVGVIDYEIAKTLYIIPNIANNDVPVSKYAAGNAPSAARDTCRVSWGLH